MSTLEFLGEGMKKVTAILFTKSEEFAKEERKRHVREFMTHPNLKIIWSFCQGKFFFTGTCNSSDAMKKQLQINRQREQQEKIIGAAVRNPPCSLQGDQYTKVSSRFMVFESAAKDSVLLTRVLPK